MKSSTARLALYLSMATVAVSLMCIGNYWLYILGLAMLLLSVEFFSLSPLSSSGARATGARIHWGRFQWLADWLVLGIAVVLLLWLTGWGRERLTLRDALFVWLVFVVPEVRYYLASPNNLLDMPVSKVFHVLSSRPPRTKQSTESPTSVTRTPSPPPDA